MCHLLSITDVTRLLFFLYAASVKLHIWDILCLLCCDSVSQKQDLGQVNRRLRWHVMSESEVSETRLSFGRLGLRSMAPSLE